MGWEDSVGDVFNEAYTAAEDKLEELEEARQSAQTTDEVMVKRAEMALGEIVTDSLRIATLSSVEHRGVLAEEHQVAVEARLQEYCTEGDQLVDMAMAACETDEVTETMADGQEAVRSSVVSEKPAPAAQPHVPGGGEGHHV